MDLLMVRDPDTGRFLYTERLERRPGETPWEYVRRSVRREARIRERFKEERLQVIVGWGAGSVRLPARRPVDHRERNFHRRGCVKLQDEGVMPSCAR